MSGLVVVSTEATGALEHWRTILEPLKNRVVQPIGFRMHGTQMPGKVPWMCKPLTAQDAKVQIGLFDLFGQRSPVCA